MLFGVGPGHHTSPVLCGFDRFGEPMISSAFGNLLAMVVPWSYHKGMSSVVKRSVSLPSELFEALELQASAEGRTVSAALTDAADLWLSTRRGLKSVRTWERQHGALTAAELAEADRILDSAGVGRE